MNTDNHAEEIKAVAVVEVVAPEIMEAKVKRASDPENTMGENIKRLRKENDWTQEFLGKKLGIDRKQVGGLETGIRKPGPKILPLLCEVFGVDEREIRYGRAAREDDFLEAALADTRRVFARLISAGTFDDKAVALAKILENHRNLG